MGLSQGSIYIRRFSSPHPNSVANLVSNIFNLFGNKAALCCIDICCYIVLIVVNVCTSLALGYITGVDEDNAFSWSVCDGCVGLVAAENTSRLDHQWWIYAGVVSSVHSNALSHIRPHPLIGD